jgi:hypothetical protein
MRPRGSLIAALGCAWLLLLLVAAPGSAENCEAVMPSQVRFARGYTFVATLAAKHPPVGALAPVWDFAVERVFVGADRPMTSPVHKVVRAGATTSFYVGGCYPVRGLRVGHRYIVSKADLVTFSSMSTVVWEVLRGGRVRLLRQYGSRDLDPRIAQPTTLRDAVALMAPHADLPRTDGTDAGHVAGQGPVLTLMAGLLGAAVYRKRRRRSGSSWGTRRSC